jgi:hypothetical protein
MKKAVVSVPYSQIHSLSAEDESGRLTGRGFFPSSHTVINNPPWCVRVPARG